MMARIRDLLFRPDQAVRRTLLRLHKDEGGNVMVLYVAAALLLVGMLWAIIGTGARLVQKETIQSSADAAAFSAAVIKAKGLNIIAFCNLLMALLLAIIMLLRLIKGALLILVGVTLAACFEIFGGEALCAFAPDAEQLYQRYSDLADRLEPRILDAMKGLAKLERGVNKSFPALALVEAYRVGTHESYQRNFGKGALVTIAWPLPVGKDLSLATKEGTWDLLCDQAIRSIDRVIGTALTSIGLPSVARPILTAAILSLLTPLKGVLCGSGGPGSVEVDTTEQRFSCDQCDGASASIWSGQRVVRNADGTFNSFPAGICKLDYFDRSLCSDPTAFVTCGDGNEYRNLSLQSCLIKKKGPAELGSGLQGDRPVPLVLADDWQDRVQTRAFTLLTDANVAARRQSVSLASKNKGAQPGLNELIGTAQAECYALNGYGHIDLWHMDWRARLARFTFGDTSSSDTGAAAGQGVPAAAAATIRQKLQQFLQNDAAAALGDQFLLH